MMGGGMMGGGMMSGSMMWGMGIAHLLLLLVILLAVAALIKYGTYEMVCCRTSIREERVVKFTCIQMSWSSKAFAS
jgi:hypothetical protein